MSNVYTLMQLMTISMHMLLILDLFLSVAVRLSLGHLHLFGFIFCISLMISFQFLFTCCNDALKRNLFFQLLHTFLYCNGVIHKLMILVLFLIYYFSIPILSLSQHPSSLSVSITLLPGPGIMS